MVDLSETPAVSPERVGGDERAGLFIAGGLLIFVGFGLGILANVLVHATAGATGQAVGPWTVSSTMGPYAWAVFGLGLFSGLVGIGLIWLARRAPSAPLVLPGASI